MKIHAPTYKRRMAYVLTCPDCGEQVHFTGIDFGKTLYECRCSKWIQSFNPSTRPMFIWEQHLSTDSSQKTVAKS